MNKTQFYSLSSALLASTALAGAASAGTIGVFDGAGVFTTAPVSIANTVFSTAASTANTIVIGGAGAPAIGIRYANEFQGTTRWSTDFTITGARFIVASGNLDNVILYTTDGAGSISGSISGSAICDTVTSAIDLLIVNDCDAANAALGGDPVGGLAFEGLQLNNASGLASVGGTVSMTAFVFNPLNPAQVIEPAASGAVLRSAAPISAAVQAGPSVIADAETTPVAFTELVAPANIANVPLATVQLTTHGALDAALTAPVGLGTVGDATATVTHGALAADSLVEVRLTAGAGGGASVTVDADDVVANQQTFTVATAALAAVSFSVAVEFDGENAIPASTGGVNVTFGAGTVAQAIPAASGAATVITQGGFRAEVNGFNAVGNGTFRSYVRIQNNGNVAGTVSVTVYNGAADSGVQLGTPFTTSEIRPNGTLQLDDAAIENGANIPAADRGGLYTLVISGPILGYIQHFLYDGEFVADMSSYRTSGTP